MESASSVPRTRWERSSKRRCRHAQNVSDAVFIPETNHVRDAPAGRLPRTGAASKVGKTLSLRRSRPQVSRQEAQGPSAVSREGRLRADHGPGGGRPEGGALRLRLGCGGALGGKRRSWFPCKRTVTQPNSRREAFMSLRPQFCRKGGVGPTRGSGPRTHSFCSTPTGNPGARSP